MLPRYVWHRRGHLRVRSGSIIIFAVSHNSSESSISQTPTKTCTMQGTVLQCYKARLTTTVAFACLWSMLAVAAETIETRKCGMLDFGCKEDDKLSIADLDKLIAETSERLQNLKILRRQAIGQKRKD
eukprot:SAG31_NODE_17934_length_652_cov_2.124774_1_plen_127_part_01